jgi:hypothetical protein
MSRNHGFAKASGAQLTLDGELAFALERQQGLGHLAGLQFWRTRKKLKHEIDLNYLHETPIMMYR